jgi:hypothetical protein
MTSHSDRSKLVEGGSFNKTSAEGASTSPLPNNFFASVDFWFRDPPGEDFWL